ncbi:MAG TPA: STAS domain-containing protein [Candidatus Eremiobacteraceae bacterium]|nr:STAS domain-containing protein [Candidatus Eremiobacteraceae bacterium]
MNKTNGTLAKRHRREGADDTIIVGRSLDAQNAKRFARSMTKLVESGTRECIIDMTSTEAVDSSGFGSLIAAVRRVGDIGGAVAIVCRDATVRRLFEVAGISRLVPVVPRMEDARIIMSAYADAALAS